MKSARWVCSVCLCAVLVSCSDSGSVSTPNLNVEDRELLARAEELAESETARLAAEALVYRSQAELHETILPLVGTQVGVYLKMYREFTDYEVVDILRSNSVLYPVEIVIRYDFDILATKVQGMSEPDAHANAQADYRFRVLRRDSVTRHYRCDAEGNPADTFSELPRLKFYGAAIPKVVSGAPGQGAVPF